MNLSPSQGILPPPVSFCGKLKRTAASTEGLRLLTGGRDWIRPLALNPGAISAGDAAGTRRRHDGISGRQSSLTSSSASISSRQSPQISAVCGFAHAFTLQAGHVYLVLLAAFFLRFAASPSDHSSRAEAWSFLLFVLGRETMAVVGGRVTTSCHQFPHVARAGYRDNAVARPAGRRGRGPLSDLLGCERVVAGASVDAA